MLHHRVFWLPTLLLCPQALDAALRALLHDSPVVREEALSAAARLVTSPPHPPGPDPLQTAFSMCRTYSRLPALPAMCRDRRHQSR
jgi:hypothetical protein